MTPRLAIEHLHKSYNGARAVEDVSLSVPAGGIFGLLGRNGAGKTTTLKCALGLVRKDGGTISFDGQPLSPEAFHGIAYVAESVQLDEWMTGAQYIEFHRRIYRHFDVTRAQELAGVFGVPLKCRTARLSKGQKTALRIVLAFAQGANLLLLDEPASGLDPYAQRLLLDLIIDLAADGRAIVFSSHQIAQIERVAESVAILDRGKIALQGTIDELSASNKIVEAVFFCPPELALLQRNPNVSVIEASGPLLRLRVRGDSAAVGRELEHLGAQSIRAIDQSLEDIFLALAPPAATEAL